MSVSICSWERRLSSTTASPPRFGRAALAFALPLAFAAALALGLGESAAATGTLLSFFLLTLQTFEVACAFAFALLA